MIVENLLNPSFSLLGQSMLCWPTEESPQRITFLADLHLFSARSTANLHEDSMVAMARQSEMVVFGGDLFDFRWSRVGNANQTAKSAVHWLERFMGRVGPRPFLYLYGNHDGDAELRQALQDLESRRQDFRIAGDLLRVGDTAFLHGDVIEGRGCSTAFQEYRDRWADKRQASHAQSRAYDAAVALRVHRLAAAVVHRRTQTFQHLLVYLRSKHCGPAEGVKRVVFGHTHRFMSGRPFAGVRFFNPGATVRGIPFQPVVLDMPA
jgi:UDP-2,3-diacylglucosamine pyrophosphatase LpxH